MRLIALAVLIIWKFEASACSPLVPPQTQAIPPTRVGDPFVYIEPEQKTAKENFLAEIQGASQVAVVDLYLNVLLPNHYEIVQSEFNVVYGWRETMSRNIKFLHSTNSGACGPRNYKLGRHVAITYPSWDNDYKLLPYSEVEEYLILLGNPVYRYTLNGIRYN